MASDFTVFVSDVLYARHLKKENHLLWISETDKPDLGGKEDEDNFFDAMATTEELVLFGFPIKAILLEFHYLIFLDLLWNVHTIRFTQRSFRQIATAAYVWKWMSTRLLPTLSYRPLVYKSWKAQDQPLSLSQMQT